MINTQHKTENHIYYDMSLNNTGSSTNNGPLIAQLFDQRDQALINNPNKWHLSVVRFTVPTSYVPIFIWPDAGGNTPNNSYYSVTIRKAGTDYRTFLTYIPQNLPAVSTNPQYLFVYSYQQFIDAINVALRASWLASGGVAPETPPYMLYNSTTGLCSLVAQYAFANSAGTYEIYFNNELFLFFDNMKVRRDGVNNVAGKDVLIYIQNNGNNDYVGHPPGSSLAVAPDSYIMTQEYDSLFLWNSVRSLVFITNTVPVANEALNIKNDQSLTSGSTFRKIMTDFEMNIQSGLSNNTLRSYVQYTPPGEYRLIDMTSNSPMYTFDIQIFFQTKDLKLYPLYINKDESISIKILFRNREFKGKL